MQRIFLKFVPFAAAVTALILLQANGRLDQMALGARIALKMLPNMCLVAVLTSVTGKTGPEYDCGRHIIVGLVFSIISDIVLTGWTADYFIVGYLLAILARGRHAASLQYQTLNLWVGALLYAISSYHMYIVKEKFDWLMGVFAPIVLLTTYTTLGRGLSRPNYIGTPRRGSEYAAAVAQILLTVWDLLITHNHYQQARIAAWLITAMNIGGQFGMTVYGMQSKQRYDEYIAWRDMIQRQMDEQREPNMQEQNSSEKGGTFNEAYSYEDQIEMISKKIAAKFDHNVTINSFTINRVNNEPCAQLTITCLNTEAIPLTGRGIKEILSADGIYTAKIISTVSEVQ